MCGEIRKPCQPSKLRTDCYVNDSTGVLQQVVSSLLCTYKIMIRWVPKHMKATGDLFSKICDMDNLRKAHKNAKRGKGWYAEVKCTLQFQLCYHPALYSKVIILSYFYLFCHNYLQLRREERYSPPPVSITPSLRWFSQCYHKPHQKPV